MGRAHSPTQTAQLDAWLAGARAATSSRCVLHALERQPPPAAVAERLLYEFRRFRARYPWVTDYASWNEANHCGEPTCHRPDLVAAYWRAAHRVPDVPDPRRRGPRHAQHDLVGQGLRRAAKVEPRYWGIHNYIDANRLRTTARAGCSRRSRARSGSPRPAASSRARTAGGTFPESAEHAAMATRFLFDALVPLSRRITRVYLYHWNSEPGPKTWDSGLIGPTGKPRPAYRVLQRVLAQRAAAKLGGT